MLLPFFLFTAKEFTYENDTKKKETLVIFCDFESNLILETYKYFFMTFRFCNWQLNF